MRVDDLLEKGDLDGRRVWQRKLKAAEGLLSRERAEGAKVHRGLPLDGTHGRRRRCVVRRMPARPAELSSAAGFAIPSPGAIPAPP